MTIHPGDGDPRHGTLNGYSNQGCRCDACRKAQSIFNAEQRRRRIASQDKPHGTTTGYQNWGCRCDACTAAMGYDPNQKRRRNERRDRIAQLVRDGLSSGEIAEITGLSYTQIKHDCDALGIVPAPPKKTPPTPEFEALAQYYGLGDSEARNKLVRVVRDQGFTLESIGAEIGVSRERIRQIAYGVATHSRRLSIRAERDRYRLAWLSARRRAAGAK